MAARVLACTQPRLAPSPVPRPYPPAPSCPPVRLPSPRTRPVLWERRRRRRPFPRRSVPTVPSQRQGLNEGLGGRGHRGAGRAPFGPRAGGGELVSMADGTHDRSNARTETFPGGRAPTPAPRGCRPSVGPWARARPAACGGGTRRIVVVGGEPYGRRRGRPHVGAWGARRRASGQRRTPGSRPRHVRGLGAKGPEPEVAAKPAPTWGGSRVCSCSSRRSPA